MAPLLHGGRRRAGVGDQLRLIGLRDRERAGGNAADQRAQQAARPGQQRVHDQADGADDDRRARVRQQQSDGEDRQRCRREHAHRARFAGAAREVEAQRDADGPEQPERVPVAERERQALWAQVLRDRERIGPEPCRERDHADDQHRCPGERHRPAQPPMAAGR